MNQYVPQDYRISDAERQQALEALSIHFAAGRLDATEYDNRLMSVANSTMKSELLQLFDDLPPAPIEASQRFIAATQPVDEDALTAYRRGRNVRIAVVALAILSAHVVDDIAPLMGDIFGLISFALFIMLFLMKLGPKSWHQPDPRKATRWY